MNCLKTIDKFVRYLVWVSVILYFVEIGTGSSDSKSDGMEIFLWTERCIAAIFMVEYALRVREDIVDPDETHDLGFGDYYCTSFLGIIDLLSWLPFLVGFFVPASWLGLIRTLRIIRLLKFFRYSMNLQLVALAFHRSWPVLRSLMFSMFVIALFSTALLREIEPNTFPQTFDAFWFSYTTATTIGFGDLSPETMAGRLVTMVTLYGFGLSIFAGMVGVVGTNFSNVITEHNEGKHPTRQFLRSSEDKE